MFSALIELEVTPLFEWLLLMLSRLEQERFPRLFSLPQLSFEHPPGLFIHSFFVLRPYGFPWPWHLLFIFRAWLLNPQYVFPSLIKLVSVLKFGLTPIGVNLDDPFLLFFFYSDIFSSFNFSYFAFSASLFFSSNSNFAFASASNFSFSFSSASRFLASLSSYSYLCFISSSSLTLASASAFTLIFSSSNFLALSSSSTFISCSYFSLVSFSYYSVA